MFNRSEFVDKITGVNLVLTDYFSNENLFEKGFKLNEQWIEKEKHFQWQLVTEDENGSAEVLVIDYYFDKIAFGSEDFDGVAVPEKGNFIIVDCDDYQHGVILTDGDSVFDYFKKFVDKRLNN